MSYQSIYHGVYQDMAIDLSTKLKELTGRDYVEFSDKEIKDARIEYALQLEEEI